MNNLPAGWEWSTIGDVSEINPRLSKADLSDDELVSFIPMASVSVESGHVDTTDVQPAGPLKKKSFRQFADGDVLVAKITPSMENGKGAVARSLAGGRGFGSTEFHVMRPSAVVPDFLLRFVLQPCFRADAARNMTGTAGQLRVPPDYLRQHPIPVPPLPEQRRIVAAIEEHFSRLDAAEASVLAAGVRADRLMAAACSSLTQGDWERRPLTEVLVSLRNGVFVSRPGSEPPGMPILRISAVRPRKLDPSDVRYADPSPKKFEAYELEPGDLLFTRYSGNRDYVGACAVVPEDGAGLLHPDKLIRGVPNTDLVDPNWIVSYLSVGKGRADIESRLKTTAGQIGISGSQLKTVEVPVPALEEQRKLVARIDEIDEAVSAARLAVAAAERRSAALRRSILASAFSGQIVPQDSSDEPASVLLERIAAERAASKPTRKKKKASS